MKELTILGRGESWKSCPFTGGIWATASVLVAEGMKDRHYDKVFAFDSEKKCPEVTSYIAIARERDIPLVSTRSYATEPYPIWGVLSEFRSMYFRNTVSYMLALAIFEGYDNLKLYGIDQLGERYAPEKSYVAFWLGMASGRGVFYTVSNYVLPRSLPESYFDYMPREMKIKYFGVCV